MSSAAAKTFMAESPVKAEALPWLDGARALEKDTAADWVKALRATAAESFSVTGLPTPAWEGWQYTNLRSLSPEKFVYSADAVKFDAQKIPAPFLDSYRIVVVNGQYQKNLSSVPASVAVMSLMEAATQNIEGLQDLALTLGDFDVQPFKALNAAYMRDGFVLKVKAGQDVDKPVEVVFYTTPGAASYPRIVYMAGENAGVTVIERYIGGENSFACQYSGIGLDRAARLKLYRFVENDAGAVHVSSALVRCMKSAVFEGFSLDTGGMATRQDLRMQLLESDVSATIGGIYLLLGREAHDFTILADHFEPGGTSVQHFKGVISDQARSIFQGKIHVHRPAQKTDGYQSHHALLLSDMAEANAKPELEIYADDVKCSHGATSGFLDQDALFYLKSRGIPEKDAKALLIESFLLGGIDRITFSAIKDIYAAKIKAWLS